MLVADDLAETPAQRAEEGAAPGLPVLQAKGGVRLVCLGASAGGLEALEAFFRHLPNELDAAFVVVVHLSPDFKSLMPELLSKFTAMEVCRAADGEAIQSQKVYVIPPGKNLGLVEGRLEVKPQDRLPGHSLNLPIDLFLRSLEPETAQGTIAVILSGTGTDGSRGIGNVKECGGVVFVQTPDSAKFDGMPVSSLQTGLVDQIGSPKELAERVAQLINPPAQTPDLQRHLAEDADTLDLSRVLQLLRARTGLDLSYLRTRMVTRRVRRRMAIEGIFAAERYLSYLEEQPAELQRLSDDLLIGVTGFFRDPEAFEALRLALVQHRVLGNEGGPQEALRVWVAACATGQEVYSMVMLLREAMVAAGVERPLKVFATDVNQHALTQAARGTYSVSDVADVPAPYLARYMRQSGSSYMVSADVRSSVLFARHNLVEDPPFTRMDLVSCRNLLIYLNETAQQQALASLAVALNPDRGLLFLGAAEVPSGLDSGLQCVNLKAKIYRRHGPLPRDFLVKQAIQEPAAAIRAEPLPMLVGREHRSLEGRAQTQIALWRRVLDAAFEAEGRSAAVISDDGRLLEVLGDPLQIFRMPKGPPTVDLTRILDRDLLTALATGRQRLQGGERQAVYVLTGSRPLGQSTEPCRWSLTLSLLGDDQEPDERLLLVISAAPESALQAGAHGYVNAVQQDASAASQLQVLQEELRQTRENLQATIEELQSSNEEQQSTNEELVASNEELQSTNEELHSVNEELFTVNAEYHRKNQELQVMSADLDNLLQNINVATLYLDDLLRVRKFTPAIGRLVPLQETDLGRPIAELVHRLDVDLLGIVQSVLESNQPLQMEVRDRSGGWLLMRIVPHRALSGQDRGLLVTFVDITKIKNAEETARLVSEELSLANGQLAAQSAQLEDLFSIVAHDLKRPVLGLDGTLKLAAQKLSSDDRPGAARFFDQAIHTMGTLRRMLQDLGDMAQLTHMEVQEEVVDVRPWLEDQLREFVQLAEQKGVALHWACDGSKVLMCRAAAEVVLGNLVENALLHGGSAPEPRVDVLVQLDGNEFRLTVSDNGRGIQLEDQERVFELFRRLHPEQSDGSGVGLVAARRLAQRAKGHLSLESEVGQGARFSLHLPARRPKAAETQVVSTLPLLLVEDDVMDVKAVRRYLPAYEIEVLGSLREAVAAVRERRFSLVLLDLSLPDGHGLALVSSMRGGPNEGVPVLLLSGQTEGLGEGALRVGSVTGAFAKDELGPEFETHVQKLLAEHWGVSKGGK